MVTPAQLNTLKSGDELEYTNVNANTTSMWVVDHPCVMINGKHCVRVSICTPTGRGSNRMSMLIDNFENWNVCQNRPVIEEPVDSVVADQAVPNAIVVDVKLPSFEIKSVQPTPNSTDVPVNSQIIFQFNQSVIKLAGNITLEAGEMSQVIDVQSQAVVVDGDKLIITPPAGLVNGTIYNVVIDPSAFADMQSMPVNILGNNVYSFTTA